MRPLYALHACAGFSPGAEDAETPLAEENAPGPVTNADIVWVDRHKAQIKNKGGEDVEDARTVDPETGTAALVPAFPRSGSFPDMGGIPSTGGRKLLTCGEKAGSFFASMGVLDFDRKMYIRFFRKNGSAVKKRSAYWFDSRKIVIRTDSSDVSTDCCVYELLESFA